MLSTKEYERLTQVVPGNFMGNRIRHYWAPAISASGHLRRAFVQHPDLNPSMVG